MSNLSRVVLSHNKSTLDLPPEEVCTQIDQIALRVKERHSTSDPAALYGYLERNADGELGTASICAETLKSLAQKGLAPRSDDALHSISNYLTETITEIGVHATSLAKERFDLDLTLPDKATVDARVSYIIEKETYAESITLETLSNNFRSLYQRHTLAIVLLDVSKLGGDYETLIQPYLTDKYFGNFWLATCPVDESACLDLMGFQQAKTIIDKHPVTLMHGLENWHEGLTDIARLVRHWHNVKNLRENKLIVLPYFDSKNKIVLKVLQEIRTLGMNLINLPIDYEQPDVEPVNWDEEFKEYPSEFQEHAIKQAEMVVGYVSTIIRPHLNKKQRAILQNMEFGEIQTDLALKASSMSLNAQRDRAKKQILDSVLKATTPAFSTKVYSSPEKFYQRYLEPWLTKFQHPVSSINEIAPNLRKSLNKNKKLTTRYRKR